MRVLFTTPVLEHPPAGGPQLRIENSIKALSTVCDLYLLSRAAAPGVERLRTEEFFRGYVKEFTSVPRLELDLGRNRYLRAARRRWRRAVNADAREDAAFLLDVVDRRRIDAVWLGYGNISFALIRRLHSLRPELKLVCDTDSVWSRFILREAPFAAGIRRARIRLAGRRKQLEEHAWVQICNVTTAVSEIDAEYYRGLTSEPARIHVFPNVIDFATYEHRPEKPADFKSPAIYLAGSFGHFHSPMDSAARWVLEKVYPRLIREVPTLHFYIVGNNSDKGFGHLNGPRVTATGKVDSVLPYLCHADVALVPLKFESGTRFKILEAAACHVPLVSTTLGAEGLPVRDGEHLLLADDPGDFAKAILRVLRDKGLASQLAKNCATLVREQFSVERLARQGETILTALQ